MLDDDEERLRIVEVLRLTIILLVPLESFVGVRLPYARAGEPNEDARKDGVEGGVSVEDTSRV
jgi:hypothetical protein